MTTRTLVFVAALATGAQAATLAGGPPQPTPALLADITPGKGLTIAGGVRLTGPRPTRQMQSVPWYQSVRLDEKDAKARLNGTCQFDVTFTLANPTTVPITIPFEVGFQVITGTGSYSAQGFGGYTLAAGEAKTDIRTLNLLPGNHVQLTYWVDVNDKIPEVDNSLADNRVWIFYDLPGTCRAEIAPPPR